MSLLLYIALRHILSSKGSTLVVSFIALAGVCLSLSAVLLTTGVFAGFQRSLKERLLSASPHIIVSLIEADGKVEELIRSQKDVKDFYFFTLYQALVSKDQRVISVSVKGLRREDAKRVYGVDPKDGVAIGEGLANLLGVKEKDIIMLISTTGRKTPFGFLPKVKSYRVEALFRKGVFEQDYATVLMSAGEAKDFFGEDYQIWGYELYLYDPYRAQEVKVELEKALGYKAIVRSWIDLNQALFNALQLEKVGIFFVLLLMVLIASFNITSLLFMKTKEKVRDIAILRTFGLKRRGVLALFLLEGFIIGFVGVLLGLLLTLVGAYLINEYRLIRVPADVYLMDHIPVHIEAGDLVITVVGALILTLVASFLPAYKASRESIVEILRNE